MWFSCAEDETFSFMPAQSGGVSICGYCRAYQDDATAIWWCRESSRHVSFFPKFHADGFLSLRMDLRRFRVVDCPSSNAIVKTAVLLIHAAYAA